MDWKTVFAPAEKGLGLKSRPQQDKMGQAVCDSITGGTNLLVEAATGTGKSLAALLPVISKINSSRPKKVRAVVATATKNLQDQYMDDLSRLSALYSGAFTYRSLKGRNNYVCFNEAKMNARGNQAILTLMSSLDRKRAALGDGERADVERVMRRELTEFEWSSIGGSVRRCAERKCSEDDCFSTRARALAAAADIVVTNTAILRVDADTRADDASDSFLGDVDILIVDEAHELEGALIDGWTEEFNQWELVAMFESITKGMDEATRVVSERTGLDRRTGKTIEELNKFLDSTVRFFSEYYSEPWDYVNTSLCPKGVRSNSPALISAMNDFELSGPPRLQRAVLLLEDVVTYLETVLKELREQGRGGTRKISVARTAATNLRNVVLKVNMAMRSNDGVVLWYGIPYSVLLQGSILRSGAPAAKISVVPMDISTKAAEIWKDRTCILMSATLRDLSDNSFRYVKSSLGFEAQAELMLETVFDLGKKQISYITTGKRGGYGDIVNVPGAQYNMQELVDLIHAARGRTLVLFTARRELEDAADYLLNSGEIPYPILVQTRDANKAKLAENFRNDTHSILLATKSFFQGVDMPTDTLSLAILVKYPLPQYNALCKNQITWWRKRGFPRWYESESMKVFQQAAGRVIRTESDYGVVALIDQRVIIKDNNIAQTALKAVHALGSPVVRSVQEVERFLK